MDVIWHSVNNVKVQIYQQYQIFDFDDASEWSGLFNDEAENI